MMFEFETKSEALQLQGFALLQRFGSADFRI
jgi:hypothetical protein